MLKEIIELVKSAKSIIENEKLKADIKVKGPADYVTRVDLEVQEYLKNELAKRFPDTLFMGEEGVHEAAERGKPIWILDPIDGTTNLIHNYNTSAVSLAFCDKDIIEQAVVYNPFTEQTFYAERGGGAYMNGERIYVNNRENMGDWLISIGTSPYEKNRADRLFELFKRIYLKTADIRRSGSAALDLCYIACGMTDGYLEQALKPWDYAAGSLILEEAGGILTQQNGEKLDFYNNCDVLAGTRECYKMLFCEIHN